MYPKLASKFGAILSQTYKDMTLYPHMYQNVYDNLLQKNLSIQECPLYKCLYSRNIVSVFFICDAILKATNSSFQRGMTFCRSIYVKKVMKLIEFIFEQPSYKGGEWYSKDSKCLPSFPTKLRFLQEKITKV